MSATAPVQGGTAGDTPAVPPARISHDGPDAPPPARRSRTGLLFVSPWIIGFLGFYLLPMLASLWFSFTDFSLDGGNPLSFVGTRNWSRVLSDPEVSNSAWVTVKYAVISMPFAIFVPLGFAWLLTQKQLWGKSFFRTMFYMPSVIPFVAAVLIFNGVLNSRTGWLNRGLETIGIPGPPWLTDPQWIYPALTIIGLWGVGNAMIIFIAGINSVPKDLYDAAEVDGASTFQMFRHITIPMISPVLFYNVVVALIGLFQYFLVPFVLKNGSGDPDGSTFFYSMYFYRVLFRLQNMGYASTLAWLLFVAGVVVTGLLFWSARYWVHYEFGEQSS